MSDITVFAAEHSAGIADAGLGQRRRVHRQHRDAMPGRDQHQPERLDEGRFADAGRARDAEPCRAPGARQQNCQHGLGGVAIVGARRFHQRDGTGERGAVARRHRLGQRGGIGSARRHASIVTKR